MPWKILTHDWRPPIQGGEPLCRTEDLPLTLPLVSIDTSDRECGAGWNFVDDLGTGFRVAGLWPFGRPAVALVVEPMGEVVTRGDKKRCAQLRLLREATTEEVQDGIVTLSRPFGDLADAMAAEQWEWRVAFGRPRRDPQLVEAALQDALTARDLAKWSIHRYDSARAAWDAWDARGARAAWAARDAWAAWDAWAARDARAAWAAWAAWAARDARDAWAAWDAWDALTIFYASRKGWIGGDPFRATTGIRAAYRSGAEVVLPTGPQELGYAMAV